MLSYKIVLEGKSDIIGTVRLRIILALGFCLCCGVATVSAQKNEAPCSDVTYEDMNQVTPNSITLKAVSGRVFDRTSKGNSQPVSSVCLGLFEETTRRLVTMTTANEKGWFKFKKAPKGKYRLVVTDIYHVFCPANIPIEINDRVVRRRKIAVYMLSRRMDQCSFGRRM